MLWLDAGDKNTGTIENKVFKGDLLNRFFNYAKLNGSAIGNHDFDLGISHLKKQMLKLKSLYLNTNIYKKKSNEWFEAKNEEIGKIVMVGDLKVGIIALTTVTTPHTTAANVSSLDFRNLTETALN